MKYCMMEVFANIPAMICFGIAGYLAIQGNGHFGWFLAIGVIVSKTVKMKD